MKVKKYTTNRCSPFDEDMKTDLRGVARAVAAHVDLSRPLCDHELDEIVRACTFEAMKDDIEKYQPISVR